MNFMGYWSISWRFHYWACDHHAATKMADKGTMTSEHKATTVLFSWWETCNTDVFVLISGCGGLLCQKTNHWLDTFNGVTWFWTKNVVLDICITPRTLTLSRVSCVNLLQLAC